MFPKRYVHVALMLGLIASCFSLPGCGSGKKKVAAYTGEPLTLAFISNAANDEFWQSLQAGADKVAGELTNIEIVWRGPSDLGSRASQSKVIAEIVELGVDGIVLAPAYENGVAQAVEAAIVQGVPVLVIDNGLDDVPNLTAHVGTDHYAAGKLAANEMANAIGDTGNVILLRHLVHNKSAQRREQGFIDGIDRYSKINLVSSDQRGGASGATARAKFNDLLLLFGGNLAGVCAVDGTNAIGTLEALRAADLEGQVKLVTFDPNETLVADLKNGSCSAIVMQDPFETGYQSVLTMVNSIQGKSIEDFDSTGEHSVTSENIDDKKIRQLLKSYVK